MQVYHTFIPLVFTVTLYLLNQIHPNNQKYLTPAHNYVKHEAYTIKIVSRVTWIFATCVGHTAFIGFCHPSICYIGNFYATIL